MKHEIETKMDAEKRDTLKKLASAAWVVPVVATFGLGSLRDASAAAAVSNVATAS